MSDSYLHPDLRVLLDVLQDSSAARRLSLSAWDRLLRFAGATGALPRLATSLLETVSLEEIPRQVHWHLLAQRQLASHNQCRILTELRCLTAVLGELDTPLVLLKGAAYLAAQSPVAAGRICSDVDLLVPGAALAAVEFRLRESGWAPKDLPPRDAKYFRRWLHEIPPLIHRYRGVEVDVHHNLLPRTDKLRLDPQKILEGSRLVEPGSRFRVLSQPDQVLHAAAHLFRNGDFQQGLRDLLDIDLLLRQPCFASEGWSQLLDRASELKLRLPCWLAVKYCAQYLQTPLPGEAASRLVQFEPSRMARLAFDRYVPAALFPTRLDGDDRRRERAVWLLAHYPLPRLRAALTPLFWLKRLPAQKG